MEHNKVTFAHLDPEDVAKFYELARAFPPDPGRRTGQATAFKVAMRLLEKSPELKALTDARKALAG